MRKLCTASGCTTIVEVQPFSKEHPRCEKHQYIQPEKKVYEHHFHNGKNIYHNSKWRKLRAIKAAQNPCCEDCLEIGIVRPVQIVDHVIEIEDGGEKYDIDNTRSLCRPCHKRKTDTEAKKRARRKEGFNSLSDFK